jgi:hypothetical protein
MQNNPQAAVYITRDSIMKLLSDEEVARVSTAETRIRFVPGEHYVDLLHLEQGVRVATLTKEMSTANLIPRRSVGDDTWRKILSELVAASVARQASPA